MRKKIIKVTACVAVMAMALAFAGCGSDDSSKDSDKKTESSVDKDEDKKKESDNKAYDSVADYVSSDEVQKELETLKATLDTSVMSIDIHADGDKLVYSYQYTSVENSQEVKDALDAELESETNTNTFVQTANGLKQYIAGDDLSVVVEYKDKNGTLITSKEYKAE